ncbi:ABC transporter ATP-binding protein [Nostoc sp. UHCC 0251]|uniref:ABC transporter ATP-binding protein n=1 Tax=Nostoc sp. UHCC 0251 TaxID=3110240 RepID=UPI002B215F1A|nr:ABC transporter ATP-binding protein [Nostoc sp. UHCC 0251]MEA5624982.1 ABC transporter ATP-binding protein [Nostoc sp. UHCC 0251]
MAQFLPKLLYLTKEHHKSLILVMVTFIFISGLEVFGTGIIGPFITVATNPGLVKTSYWLSLAYTQLHFDSEKNFLIALGALVLFSFYVKAFFAFIAQKSVFEFGYRLKGELAYKLLKSYLEAPYSFHLRVNSATLIQNVITTTDNVCIGVVMPLLTSISNAFIVVTLILLLVNTSSMALILIAILLPVIFVSIKMLKKYLFFWNREAWEACNEMICILNHGLGSFKETRIIGCESYFEQKMEEQTHRYAENWTLSQSYGNLPRFVIEAFMMTFLITFTLLFLAINQGKEQNLTGILGIFALASIRLLPAVSNMVGNINTLRSNTFAVDRLFFDLREIEETKVLSTVKFTDNSEYSKSLLSHKRPFLSFKDKIVLNEVNFQYPDSLNKSLDQVSIKIDKGQSIGLIGKSGAGKTTLVDVLLGLFIPQSGDIKVDGVSIYGDLRAWQNMLGYVPQSIFLTDDTLERNVAFGVPDHLIDKTRLQKALELAQLNEVVDQLPDGIKTVVGERGVLLSGGQRQRVGIARVLYHEREILVFDEATAALDNETEMLITEATKSLSGIKTIIIIAHRLSTIEHCDRIYQLDQGRIIKSGSYQEVVLGKLENCS